MHFYCKKKGFAKNICDQKFEQYENLLKYYASMSRSMFTNNAGTCIRLEIRIYAIERSDKNQTTMDIVLWEIWYANA